MPFPVKLFASTDFGAPVLTGSGLGSMIGVLDVLVNGYNALTLDGITRAGSTATATKATHNYKVGDILLIAGANEAEYNGEQRVTAVTTNTFTFEVTGTPATPATGTITSKIAPAGWEKVFSGTNKAAYRSLDSAGTRMYLRVDDSATFNASVRGYEAMSDVDTGTGPFPTTAQAATYLWPRSSTNDATARPWALIADGRLFHLFVRWSGTVNGFEWIKFGDFVSFKSADAYGCMINAFVAAPAGVLGNSGGYLKNSSANSMLFCPRSYTQLGSAINLTAAGMFVGGTSWGSAGVTYPNPVDNALHVRNVYDLFEGTAVPGNLLRGYLPGVYEPVHAGPLAWLDTVTNVTGLPGKTLSIQKPGQTGIVNTVAIDITGPWR